MKKLSSGDFVAVGYCNPFGSNNYFPTVIKFNSTGTIIWQKSFNCFSGWSPANNIFETPQGLVITGIGAPAGNCSSRISPYTFRIDLSSGNLDNVWGIKFYNDVNMPLPAPMNGATKTELTAASEGLVKSCEILNSAGNNQGYIICANLDDNTNTGISNLKHGGVLLKINAQGYLDQSFNGSGIKIIHQDIAGSIWMNTQFHGVCINYDGVGNPIGMVVVGTQNENKFVAPLTAQSNNDVYIAMFDMTGNLTYENRFDELTQHKETVTPYSMPYTDQTDNLVPCSNANPPNLGQENSNERATRVIQRNNGGPFYVVCQFDYTYWTGGSGCSSYIYPSGNGLLCDVAVLELMPNGLITWMTNIYQNGGRDYENEILMEPGGDIIVLGATNMEPFSSPNTQHTMVSRLDIGGNVNYTILYNDNSYGQTMFCPFGFALDATGGAIIIVGDNELNNDDMQIMKVGL